MKKFRADINKFSFAQLTSNSDGKTSGSGTAGLYVVFIGGVCFLLGCIDKIFFDRSSDILTQSIVFVSIGATLLGYRKYKDSGVSEMEQDAKEVVEENTGDKSLNS
ncbi:MAG: hypothetical protein EBS19_14880 [Spirochaetia bacterium]|nr:hypothetical protein [Spirochaetia bacterium]